MSEGVCVCVIGCQGGGLCECACVVCIIQACSRSGISIHCLIYEQLRCLIADSSLSHAGTNEDCMYVNVCVCIWMCVYIVWAISFKQEQG